MEEHEVQKILAAYNTAREELDVRASVAAAARQLNVSPPLVAWALGLDPVVIGGAPNIDAHESCAPMLSHRYAATFNDSYEPGGPVGYGPTRWRAIGDLLEQTEESRL